MKRAVLALAPNRPRARTRHYLGWTLVQTRLPKPLHRHLRHWAVLNDVSVQEAIEQAIRLLLRAPELETPFEVVESEGTR